MNTAVVEIGFVVSRPDCTLYDVVGLKNRKQNPKYKIHCRKKRPITDFYLDSCKCLYTADVGEMSPNERCSSWFPHVMQ
jgi:hypothetical protein